MTHRGFCWPAGLYDGYMADENFKICVFDQKLILMGLQALCSSCSELSLGEWKFMLLRPSITFIPLTWPLRSWAHCDMKCMTRERSWQSIKRVTVLTWLLNSFHEITFWWSVSWDTKIPSYPSPIWRDLPTYFLSKWLSHWLSYHGLSKFLT